MWQQLRSGATFSFISNALSSTSLGTWHMAIAQSILGIILNEMIVGGH